MKTSVIVTVSAEVSLTTQVEDFLRDRGYRSFALWRARPVNGRVALTVESTGTATAQEIANAVNAVFGV